MHWRASFGRASNQSVIEYTLEPLSVPNYVIKKRRPRDHKYGKTPEKKEYHQAHNLKKRCTKKHLKGIHDHDPVFRANMIEKKRSGSK